MAGQDWFEKDFYAVLGVPQDASPEAIKKAYRKLARKHHPDASGGRDGADQRFKEIGEAYAVLSDPEQRQQYDAIRAMTRGGARFTAGGPGGGPGGFEDLLGGMFGDPGGRRVRFSTGGAGGPSLEDLLGGVFSGGGGAGFRAPRGPSRGEDLAAEAKLTFAQSVEGAMLELRVPADRGGAARTVRARIPAGVRDGQKVRLPGKGRPGEGGGPAGDLVVTVHVEPHPLFSASGPDLRITVPVTFTEAALGGEITVPTFDGTLVRVKVPPGTPSGRTLRVRGRGARTAKRTGDLLVTVTVVVPQRLDDAAREALEAFRAATSGDDPRAELSAWARARGAES